MRTKTESQAEAALAATYDPATAADLPIKARLALLAAAPKEPGWHVGALNTHGWPTVSIDAADAVREDLYPDGDRTRARTRAWIPCDPTSIAQHAARLFGHDAHVSLDEETDGQWTYWLNFYRNGERAYISASGPTRHDAAIELLRGVVGWTRS